MTIFAGCLWTFATNAMSDEREHKPEKCRHPIEVLSQLRLSARSRCEEQSLKSIQTFLTVSGGTLALLAAFAKDVFPAKSNCEWMIYAALFLLIISLVTSVATLIGRNNLQEKFWKNVRELSDRTKTRLRTLEEQGSPLDLDKEARDVEDKIADLPDTPGCFYTVCSYITPVAFGLGLIFLAMLAFVNWTTIP